VTAIGIITQQFPRLTKEREWHDDAPRLVVRPRDVRRAEMRRFLEDTLEDVANSECQFWACPGPDKPTRHMATCAVCYRIKRLRVMLGWLS
jgi:hypothetical protein